MHAMPAYRRFVNDLRDPRCIPAVDAPEIAALEAERVRLVAALDEAKRSGGHVDDARYIAQRAKAIREGTEMPPPPPTAAEQQAANEQRNRNVAAAENALVAFGDVICRTVEAHPEWREEALAKVSAAQAEAAAAVAAARSAERRAVEARGLVLHLERTAADELYVAKVTSVPKDDEDVVWEPTDPYIRDLVARSRTEPAL